jgi:uncharacterized phage protein (TIGR02220 family)
MALRDQPYLPLYVQDYLTDEKLNECSASTQGIYIKIMCIMHKSDEYGCILLEQKYKQTDNQIKNFALKLVKHLPFSEQEILNAITELLEEKVLHLCDDKIFQKRMVKDNDISLKRSDAGQKGGNSTQFAKANNQAKDKANTVIENEIEIENIIEYLNKKSGKNFKPNTDKTKKIISVRLKEKYTIEDFKKVIDIKCLNWLGDKKMQAFVRPETLFGTKFESYLNECPSEKPKLQSIPTDDLFGGRNPNYKTA